MTPQELRTSILQYAIQGRLTEQNADDLSLNNVFSSIHPSDNVPYDLPVSWKWFRLEDIATLYNGRAYKKPEMLTSGKYPLLRVGNLFTNDNWYYSDLELEPEKYCEEGDLLYAWSASFGPHIWKGEKVIYHYHIWKVELKNPDMRDYLYWALEAQTQALKKSAHGSTMIHITKANTEKMMIPLPPLAEQKRIVAKLEEILPLIDRYEAAWNKLEEFNKRFPGDMQKSILQLAIQGKLVEQRPEEGTGEELFQQIQAEKQALIKAGKIKKEEALPEIADIEIPFDIPDTWHWVRLGDCSTYTQRKEKVSPSDITSDMWSLDLEDIEKGTGRIVQYCKASERKIAGDKVKFYTGQVLYSKLRPYLKKVLVAPADGICTGEIVPFSVYGNIEPQYIVYVLTCPHVDYVINSVTYGVKMPRVGTQTMAELLIPLPPLAEQKRIVAKLEEILPLCDRLK